jgi:hypothetical protein
MKVIRKLLSKKKKPERLNNATSKTENPIEESFFERSVPIDILKAIFSHFNDLELVRFVHVNKRWRTVVADMRDWKYLALSVLLVNGVHTHPFIQRGTYMRLMIQILQVIFVGIFCLSDSDHSIRSITPYTTKRKI